MTTNICNRCLASVVLTEHGGLDFRDEESEQKYKETLLCQACQDRDRENGREIQLAVPPKRADNCCMMIKENKITHEDAIKLLAKSNRMYKVHGIDVFDNISVMDFEDDFSELTGERWKSDEEDIYLVRQNRPETDK